MALNIHRVPTHPEKPGQIQEIPWKCPGKNTPCEKKTPLRTKVASA